MDLGITLPTSGPHASPDGIVRMARAAEELGYAAVWTYERLLYPIGDVPQPGGPPRPLPEHLRTTYEPLEVSWHLRMNRALRTPRRGSARLRPIRDIFRRLVRKHVRWPPTDSI